MLILSRMFYDRTFSKYGGKTKFVRQISDIHYFLWIYFKIEKYTSVSFKLRAAAVQNILNFLEKL